MYYQQTIVDSQPYITLYFAIVEPSETGVQLSKQWLDVDYKPPCLSKFVTVKESKKWKTSFTCMFWFSPTLAICT